MQVEIVITGNTEDLVFRKLMAYMAGDQAIVPSDATPITHTIENDATPAVATLEVKEPEEVKDPEPELTREELQKAAVAFYKAKTTELNGDQGAARAAFVEILSEFVTEPKVKGKPQISDLDPGQYAAVFARVKGDDPVDL